MALFLNKKSGDIYALCGVLILTSAVFSYSTSNVNASDLRVHVYVRDDIVYEMPLSQDQVYIFYKSADAGSSDVTEASTSDYLVELDDEYGRYLLGPITVEVKDRKIDVLKETSEHHYCALMPATGQANWSLTCAPNFFRVVIEGQK